MEGTREMRRDDQGHMGKSVLEGKAAASRPSGQEEVLLFQFPTVSP